MCVPLLFLLVLLSQRGPSRDSAFLVIARKGTSIPIEEEKRIPQRAIFQESERVIVPKENVLKQNERVIVLKENERVIVEDVE